MLFQIDKKEETKNNFSSSKVEINMFLNSASPIFSRTHSPSSPNTADLNASQPQRKLTKQEVEALQTENQKLKNHIKNYNLMLQGQPPDNASVGIEQQRELTEQEVKTLQEENKKLEGQVEQLRVRFDNNLALNYVRVNTQLDGIRSIPSYNYYG